MYYHARKTRDEGRLKFLEGLLKEIDVDFGCLSQEWHTAEHEIYQVVMRRHGYFSEEEMIAA